MPEEHNCQGRVFKTLTAILQSIIIIIITIIIINNNIIKKFIFQCQQMLNFKSIQYLEVQNLSKFKPLCCELSCGTGRLGPIRRRLKEAS